MQVTWTKKDLADRGQMSDQALANRMKVDVSTVRKSRVNAGIEPYLKHSDPKPWSDWEISLLGTKTDKKVAIETGRPVEHVRQARSSRGIKVIREKAVIDWTAQDLADMGKVLDEVIAARKGCSLANVRWKRRSLGKRPPPRIKLIPKSSFTEVEIALFGTNTDAKVAKQIGSITSAVKGARISRGISAYTHPSKGRYVVPANSGLALSWTELQTLNQYEFFKALADAYREKVGKPLTFSKLAKLSLWSTTQLKHWFTPQRPVAALPITTRHHIWLSVAIAV